MVACAPLALAAVRLLAQPSFMQPACAVVDQLKQQLLLAVENNDINSALDAVSKLEKSALTKEILEATRIGGAVNEARKKISTSAPEVAKRCRALIKAWQKLAEFQRPPSSNSSSTNGTPRLVSPAVRRGLTPHTPARRITSTGLQAPGTVCPPPPSHSSFALYIVKQLKHSLLLPMAIFIPRAFRHIHGCTDFAGAKRQLCAVDQKDDKSGSFRSCQ
jgi:hypothetical protein